MPQVTVDENKPQRIPLSQRAASPELAALYASECQRCGVCCMYHTQTPFGIPVTEDFRPPQKFIQIGPHNQPNNPHSTTHYMRIVPDSGPARWKGFRRCMALEGVPRKSVSCSVYDSRPLCCHLYAPGSAACINARSWAHYAPLDDGYGHS